MTAAHAEWSIDAARDLLARIDEPGPVLLALHRVHEVVRADECGLVCMRDRQAGAGFFF